MISRDTRNCKAGITLWAIRDAIRSELADNPRFRKLIDTAVGGDQIKRIHAIKRLGCRYDLLLETETSGGDEGRIVIRAALDEPADPDPQDGPHWVYLGRRDRGRSEILWEEAISLRFAPRTWFERRKIRGGLTFEDALHSASKDFRTILKEGIARSERALALVGTKRTVPNWVRWQTRR